MPGITKSPCTEIAFLGKEFIATGADLFLALDNEDTPYTEQNGLIKPEVQAEEKPLMDYCQKLIVLFDTEN